MKKYRTLIIVFIVLLLILITILGFNTSLKVTYYTYESDRIPTSFDEFKIVQISDLHGKLFGNNQKELISTIEKLKPDVIFFTGDIINENCSDVSSVEFLLDGIKDLAPIYMVDGNHDNMIPDNYNILRACYAKYGVRDLNNSFATITIGTDTIYIYGENKNLAYKNAQLMKPNQNEFNILLYHYGNFFDQLSQYRYDLIFSGHTHGGIICIPGIGGLIANDGSLFPKYDSGIFHNGISTMILSSGLGDNKIPRFYNRPEVICVTLRKIK